jgi:phosphoglucosamine mutase
MMVQKQKPLSEMAHELEILPQVLLNVRVRVKKELQEIPELIKLEKKINQNLGDSGRTLLRFSGTEPVLRIMLEGQDQEKIQGYAQDLKLEAEKVLGKG